MKKSILFAIMAMFLTLTTNASPIVIPECGCGDPKAKTVNTPDSELTAAEINIKQMILSNSALNLPGVSFRSFDSLVGSKKVVFNSVQNCSAWVLGSGAPSVSQAQINWSASMKQWFLDTPGYWCPCIKYTRYMGALDYESGQHLWQTCASVTYSLSQTECSCIDDSPF